MCALLELNPSLATLRGYADRAKMLGLMKRAMAPKETKSPLNETVKGIVFDLDGTLCDSLEEIKEACDHALWTLEKRPPFPVENYALFAGNGDRMLLARVLMAADIRARGEMAPVSSALQTADPDKDAERVSKAVALKTAYEENLGAAGKSKVEAFAGASALLSAARSAGVKVAVLSNKRQAPVSRTVRAAFGDIDFVDVVGATEGAPPPKPDPAALLAIVQKMRLEPSQCAMVGDTDVDMKTATAAGVCGVGVTWGFRDESELKSSGAQHVASSMSMLHGLLLKP